jgi:hypothetical protein
VLDKGCTAVCERSGRSVDADVLGGGAEAGWQVEEVLRRLQERSVGLAMDVRVELPEEAGVRAPRAVVERLDAPCLLRGVRTVCQGCGEDRRLEATAKDAWWRAALRERSASVELTGARAGRGAAGRSER